jgi:hypothetical protein
MPAAPTLNDVKSVALEVVDRPPRRNPWRPTTLTIRKFLRICHLVEKGSAITQACEVECITYARFRQRVQRSARLAERLKEAETVRFNLRHEEALQIIMEAAQRSWMAAGWWLERNIPGRYALRPVPRDSADEQAEEEIPSQVLLRHRALLLELAEEDRQKQSPDQVPEPTRVEQSAKTV